jgi:NAD+ kinase
MIKKVGLVVKDTDASLELGKEIRGYLASKEIETFFDDLSASKIGIEGLKIEEMRVDIMLALGGDGTILKTVSKIGDKKIPLLGINFGATGFLTEINPNEWKESLNKILRGEYKIDEREKIEAKIDGEKIGEALNESVVMTSAPVKMLRFNLRIGGITEEVKADGVIISTPTGSTAYSLSAGGPVVHPKVKAFVVTPICPFESTLHPLVLPQDSRIEISLIKPKKNALIILDGVLSGELKGGSVAEFGKSKNKACFIRLRNFYKVK